LLTALLAAGTAVTPVRADFVLYDTPAAFQAATTSLTTVNFEGIAAVGGFVFEPAPPGLTHQGVNFTIDRARSNGNLFVIGDNFYYPNQAVVSSSQSTTAVNDLLITPPAGSNAFSFNLGTFSNSTVTFTLSTGETFTRNTPAFAGQIFVGVVDSAPITSIRLEVPQVASEQPINLSQFQFGTGPFVTTAVPEPAGLTLLGLGALGLAGGSYRRRRTARPH
jgi:hypothetical protein